MDRPIRHILLACCILLGSCVSMPKGAVPVRPFDLKRYAGVWYEIARYDFRFERNLDNVTATYEPEDGGGIRVINRGRDTTTGKWKESTGKAKPRGDGNDGRLKVSFFGPFYSGYNVIALDPGYQYALVAGDNLKYLWLLSRRPDMPAAVRQDYLKQAQRLGYDTTALIWTAHTMPGQRR